MQTKHWPDNPGRANGTAQYYRRVVRADGPGWEFDVSKCRPIAPARALDAAPSRAMDHRRRMHAALDRMLARRRPSHPVEDADIAALRDLLRDENIVAGLEKGAGEALGAAGSGARLGSEAGEAALSLIGDDDDDDDDRDEHAVRMIAPFATGEGSRDDDDDDDEKTIAELAPLALAADKKRRRLRARDSAELHWADLNERYAAAFGRMAPETGTRPSGPQNLSQYLDEAHAARRSQSRGFDSKAPVTDLEYYECQAALSGPVIFGRGR
ncbi:MAG TPA: hypothetical protein VMH80_03440 [Bryobacteraceae bacterium]|nr:hypothetical protein [Bryobacteraceae bacterium]